MSKSAQRGPATLPDRDAMYREGTPPWDTGRPAAELVRVLREGAIKPGSALQLGCGSGADAVYLAQQGFEVTAVDSSPIALERARMRAQLQGVPVRFILGDVLDLLRSAERFDLVYDADLYHYVRQTELGRYLELLWRVTRPGSFFLALVGSTQEEAPGGPPQVSEDQVRLELGRLFEFVHLRPFRFESRSRREGYLGWSCLMRRPQVVR